MRKNFTIKKSLTFTLICLLLITANVSLVSAQTQTGKEAVSAAKIKADVVKYGTDKKKRVQVKLLDGTKTKGYINQANEESFVLTDSKTNQAATIAYRDVAQVKRSGYSKSDKIILGVVIGAAAVVGIVVGSLFAIRCRNEGGC